MNAVLAGDDLIRVLFVLVLGTAALILSQRSLTSLISIYAFQSLLLAAIALTLFAGHGPASLVLIAIITIVSKAVIIPVFLRRILSKIPVKRDLEFRYVTPVTSLLLGTILIFVVYKSLSALLTTVSPGSMLFLGAVIGISLALMGMMIIFSRKKVITKIIGYLTMENGVLLFSLFIAELPFIIEILIVIDLLMVILLSAIMAFGIDSSVEEFHKKLNSFGIWFED